MPGALTRASKNLLRLIGFTVFLVASWPVLSCSREREHGTAEPLRLAVASNFSDAIQTIVAAFQRENRIEVAVSTGSTGKLAAQIENGAPYQVFLAGDSARPARLEQLGIAEPGSRFTYALGRLALYGKPLGGAPMDNGALNSAELRHLAIANPKTAPYGLAAQQALLNLGFWNALKDRIVQGENVAQAHQFVSTGSAELGFVALSLVLHEDKARYYVIPGTLYDPIRQDAVLLSGKPSHEAAEAFMRFLRSKPVRRIIQQSGYGLP